MTPVKIAEAIISADKNAISKADGIGAKIAMRIITELKDKPETTSFAKFTVPQSLENGEINSSLLEDGISALVNLGYQRSDAYLFVSKILSSSKENIKISELIKLALKEIGNKG